MSRLLKFMEPNSHLRIRCIVDKHPIQAKRILRLWVVIVPSENVMHLPNFSRNTYNCWLRNTYIIWIDGICHQIGSHENNDTQMLKITRYLYNKPSRRWYRIYWLRLNTSAGSTIELSARSIWRRCILDRSTHFTQIKIPIETELHCKKLNRSMHSLILLSE